MAGPARGELWLRSDARPALGPGDYRLELGQRVHEGDPNAPIGNETVTRSLRISAPRFTLPGTEVHSVFPPPNANGSFQDRLAQIVLKRKTLPWERGADDAPIATRRPWLALVLLADGEANFMPGVAVADAMPEEVRAALGVTETGTCDALEVPDIVVAKVFPYRDELPLLCHVRQVNMEDTEFAGTDDDGFLSAVVANRLPQAGQRYRAYLVSLEGQLDVLPVRPPDPPPTARVAAAAVSDLIEATHVYEVSEDVLRSVSYRETGGLLQLSATEQPPSATAPAPAEQPSAWQQQAAQISVDADGMMPRAGTAAAYVLHETDFPALHAVLEQPEPVLHRFPVLAHWTFTCSEEPGFQALAATIDVGLLGKQPRTAEPEPAAFAVADTGHTVVDRITRRGERGEAWYRGPLTPREVKRRPAAGEGVDDPRARHAYHVADQAVRVAEDGREDISEAAAFELGRMLALADPVFTAALAGWRRSVLLAGRVAASVAQVPAVATVTAVDGALARGLASTLVTEVSTAEQALSGERPLGRVVPREDLAGMLDDADAAVIAEGMDLPRDLVADILAPGITQTPLAATAPDPKLPTEFDEIVDKKETFAHLDGQRERLSEQIKGEMR